MEQFVFCGRLERQETSFFDWTNVIDANELIFSYQKEPTEKPNDRLGFKIWLKCDDPPLTTVTFSEGPSTTFSETTPSTSLGTTPGTPPGSTAGSTIDTTFSNTDDPTDVPTDETTEGTDIYSTSLASTVPPSNRLEASGSIASTIEYTDDLADPSSQAFQTYSENISSELKKVFETTDDVAKATVTIKGFRNTENRERRSGTGDTVIVDFKEALLCQGLFLGDGSLLSLGLIVLEEGDLIVIGVLNFYPFQLRVI